ncbi:MAG: proline dehydrogenase family protein [Actinomycetia bacterium]|nr:proline dehydrogenase family protein [Actinomycetes bacterium]
MLRTAMMAAAAQPWLRRFSERSPLVRPVVNRFIAGATEPDALRVCQELVDGGMYATLDFLGEDTTSREQADKTVAAYLSVLPALADAGLADRIEVSIKLTAFGQGLPDGEKISLDNAHDVCVAAAAAGTTVTLDMEDHTTTDKTLGTLAELRKEFPWVGIVLQSYLTRTEGDCRDLATAGSRVRLCKGAYAEPPSVAYQGSAVEDSYRRCLAILFAGDGYPMIASHDPAMALAARDEADRNGRAADSYEFQMLYGFCVDRQRQLVEAGRRMRIYVPYGTEWYGYYMRRMAERPANLMMFVRSIATREGW